MAKGGEFVTKLRKDWSAQFASHTPFQFTAVAGENDEFVPYESSLGPFDKSVHAIVAGNHLEIIRPQERNNRGVQLVVNRLSGGTAQIGPWDGARLAVEAREFQKAIDLFEPHKDQLDDAAAIQLAIALEKFGRQNDAIDLLRARGKPTTDAMGTLAGRLKRRWLRERREDDATRAMELYRQAYDLSENSDPAQAYYHAINIAFMNLALSGSLPDAQIWARRALEHCSAAAKIETNPRMPGDSPQKARPIFCWVISLRRSTFIATRSPRNLIPGSSNRCTCRRSRPPGSCETSKSRQTWRRPSTKRSHNRGHECR